MEQNTIHLELEDGKRIDCDVLAVFELDKKEYIALLPSGEETVFLYGYNEVEGAPELTHIESDEEYEKVSEAFMHLCEEDEELEEE